MLSWKMKRNAASAFAGWMVLGVLIVGSAGAFAEDVEALLKQANTDLRSAQSQFFNGKYAESSALLDGVAKTIEQIKAADPENAALKSVEQKYQRQRADLDKRMAKPASSAAKPAAVAAPAGTSDKLPGGVTSRLKNIGLALDKAEGVLAKEGPASNDWRAKQAQYEFDGAKGVLEDMQKGYAGQYSEDHPEVKAVLDRMKAVEARIQAFGQNVQEDQAAAEAAKQAGEAASAQWIAKFRPYLAGPGQEGHDPARYFVAGGTANPDELLQRQRIFEEVSALFDDYKKAPAIVEKTWELEEAEKKLTYAIDTFRQQYQESVNAMGQEARQKLDEALAFQTQDVQWKNDEKKKPLLMPADQIKQIEDRIAVVAKVQPDSPDLSSLKEGFGKLQQENENRRKIFVERTLMTADKYTGGDLEQLRGKAREIVTKAFPDATILRVTVHVPDWQEEDVIESTDTTHTALRHRITRSLAAQVAGKRGSEVSLYTVHIAKDKQSDGSWGSLYGHIMYTDAMLEKNVNRNAP